MPSNKKGSSLQKVESSNSSSKSAKKVIPQFPVAAIGASAGGLEAIKLFLENVPDDTGISFIIV